MITSFKNIIVNVPPVTRTLFFTTLFISIAAYISIYRVQLAADPDTTPLPICPFLGLIPGFVIYSPWTFVTALFYESNSIKLIFSCVVLLFCGKYLERAWGSRELIKFIGIVGVLTNVITWLAMLLTYHISGNESYLYETQINGMAGVFSGFLVAFRYLVPEHRIALLSGMLSIRVKNAIGVATAVSIVLLIFFNAVVFYNLVNISWVIAWVYIRFFKYQDGIRGDRSDTFAIVTFFPEFLHPVIGFISNTVYGVLVQWNLCRPQTFHDIETGDAPVPGSARAEAERRRALALKTLDMRLSKAPASSPADPASSSRLDTSVLFDAEDNTPSAPTAGDLNIKK
ncbi:eukaryotic integral membrane protein-domain-containing protein [Pilobolus umbonatus]|nr:eukaryotic integral membrane protein-domain-containing protein [Pilobolus umbonatus]